MINHCLHLLVLFILSIEIRLTLGFMWYFIGTWNGVAYEDRWKLFGFGYHIKESEKEIYFKLGFLK